MNKHTLLGLPGLLATGLLFANLPAAAQQGSCAVKSSTKQVCGQISSQPTREVQASGMNGSDTFVRYTAKFVGSGNPSNHCDDDDLGGLTGSCKSTSKMTATFTMSPGVAITEVSTTSGTCSVDGAAVSCEFDKHGTNPTDTIEFTAQAPQYTGTSTPTTLIASGVYGWSDKKTATLSKAVSVTTSGGETYVPPGESATLVTSPENPDPSMQTTPENPLFAKLVIPGRSIGFVASLGINNTADEDFSLSCSAGLFHSGTSDGGPYACRDIGAPFDAGVGTRWIEVVMDSEVENTFTDAPLKLTLIWDASIMSPLQTGTPPNELPPLAVFYHAQEMQGSPLTHPIRAFANPCSTHAPPCLSGVQRYGTGDWTATLELSDFYNPDHASPILARVYNAIDAMLAGLVGKAWAPPPTPPVIAR